MENLNYGVNENENEGEERYDPFELLKYLLSHKLNNNTQVYYNKIYPLFNDFLLWKNVMNKDEKYQIEYNKIKDRINTELITKKYSELPEIEKNTYLLQFKYYINNIVNIKNAEVKEMEKLHNDKSKQIRILQEQINKKSMEDMELDNKMKNLEEMKIKKKHELKKKLDSIKKKSLEYKEKMKKSEEIINNYENSVGDENDISIINIVSGLKEEFHRLNKICEEQELEIASLDKRRKELGKDVELLEKTPNKIRKY